MRTVFDRLFLVLLTIIVGLVVAIPRLFNCSCDAGDDALAEESHEKREQIDFEEFMKEPTFEKRIVDPEQERLFNIKIERMNRIRTLRDNIHKINNDVSLTRAMHIATEIVNQSDFVDPPIHENLVASIIARESFFSLDVQEGRRRGNHKEIGLMQIHPGNKRAIAQVIDNEEDRECVLTDIRCNIMSGVVWLNYVRNLCKSDDIWIWMAAYQMKSCPTSKSARQFKGTKNARAYFCQITPDCNKIWPM